MQRASDVAEVRGLVAGRAGVLAKLEKPAAVAQPVLDAVVAAADACMVARGDLGVELPPEHVPVRDALEPAACDARTCRYVTRM